MVLSEVMVVLLHLSKNCVDSLVAPACEKVNHQP